MGKYGTNREGFGAFEGGVNADKGAPLVSTSSDGETALLFGPAALREIQTGVANGDFAIPPDAAGDTITESNPLPYWTFTDVNSAGAITCAVVADASSGSGNTLRFTITAGTPNSRSVTLRRFIPVASTRNQAFAYAPEVNTFGATNTAISTIRMQSQFYEADQTTTTGAVNDSGVVTFATLGTGSNWLTGTVSTANAAPADAAFCLITITVATAAAGTVVASTVDIPEVRLIRGDQTNLFAEYRTPGTYAPTYMRQQNGELQISPNGGTGNTELGGSLTVVGGTIDTSGDMTVASGNGDLIIKDTSAGGAPRLQFMTSDGTYRGGIRLGSTQNFAFVTGDTTDDYGFVLAERFYPMNGTTGSRYIDDDGTRTRFSGAIRAAGLASSGAIENTNGSYYADTPAVTSGTGQIANSAQWLISSGTNWQLRRSTGTSWAKFKKDIANTSISPEQFKALRFVQFHWDGPKLLEQYPDLSYVQDEMQHGVLLDQLVDVMPEAIQQPQSDTDTETVSWHIVHMAAMVALQDAISRIEDLEQRLADLESR